MRAPKTWSLVNDACTLFVVGMAAWSLVFQTVVLLGGTIGTLVRVSPVAAILAVVLFVVLRQRWSETSPAQTPDTGIWSRGWRPLLLTTIPPTAFVITEQFVWFWAPACVILFVAWVMHLRPSLTLKAVAVVESGMSRWVLIALGLATALAFMIVHRPNGDDPFYLNLVAGTLDNPLEPLLRFDHLHGVPGVRMLMPVYQVHSWDLLPAVVTALTGMWHIAVKNLWLPALTAPFAVVAAAFLLQHVIPRYWLPATIMVIGLMITMTFFSAGFGNTSFGRWQHGKPVFVSVIMPIIVTLAIRYSAEGGWRTWLLLLLGQVAAVGTTSTAMWAGPVALGLALGGSWVPTRAATMRMLAGLTTAIYPIAMALVFAAPMRDVVPVMTDTSLAFIPPIEEETALQFGYGAAAWLFLWSICGAWAIPSDPVRRRLIAGTALGMLALFYNPFLMRFWSLNVTGIPTFGRFWWALPRHIWLGMMIFVPFSAARWIPRFHAPATVGVAAVILGVFAFVAVPGGRYPRIEFNEIAFTWPPTPKVPHSRMEIIRKIGAGLPPRSIILAPYRLAPWIGVDRGSHYPVALSDNYLNQIATGLGLQETERRRRLLHYMDGTVAEPDLLALSIPALDIRAVVSDGNNPYLSSIREVAMAAGMREETVDRYVVFKR